MGVLDIFRRSQSHKVAEEQRSDEGPVFGLALNYNGYGTYKTSQAMALAAVHRCVIVIMNGVASLPVRLYAYDDKG